MWVRRWAESTIRKVSRCLAAVLKKDSDNGWPDGYFERVVGGWKGEPLTRPPQGESEERHVLR